MLDNRDMANVYPLDNTCFLYGVTEVIKQIETRLYKPLQVVWREYTFIDLTHYTFRYLIENEEYWLDELKDKKIVFICDRHLAALANYWFINFNVFGIVYNDRDDHIVDELTYVINGRFMKKDIKYCNVTKKEMEILKQISQGLSPKIIARAKDCSVKTVYSHRKNISEKLDVMLI